MFYKNKKNVLIIFIVLFGISSAFKNETAGSDTRLDTDTAGASYSHFPQISSDGSGHVYVTWQDWRNGNYDIYFNYSVDNGATCWFNHYD